MSSILFAMEVVAFILVAAWAYHNDRIALEEGGVGLLALKSAGEEEKPAKKQPRWHRNARPSRPPTGPQPRWKLQPAPGRW